MDVTQGTAQWKLQFAMVLHTFTACPRNAVSLVAVTYSSENPPLPRAIHRHIGDGGRWVTDFIVVLTTRAQEGDNSAPRAALFWSFGIFCLRDFPVNGYTTGVNRLRNIIVGCFDAVGNSLTNSKKRGRHPTPYITRRVKDRTHDRSR